MSEKNKITNSTNQPKKLNSNYTEDPGMRKEEEEVIVSTLRDDSGEDQDELLNLLTLDYIDQVERGENPNLTEYVKRYPRLEEGLKANITYYWQETKDLFDEFAQEEANPGYEEELLAFINNPAEQERMNQVVAEIATQLPLSARAQNEAPQSVKPLEPALTDLYKAARAKGFTPPQLAKEVGISIDLMLALQRRTVLVIGLPRKLALRVSEVLGISLSQLLNYWNGPALPSANYFNTDKPEVTGQQNFATYVLQSESLTPEQRSHWLKEIETDAFTALDVT